MAEGVKRWLMPWRTKGKPLSVRDPDHFRNREGSYGESVNEQSVLGLSAAWACVNLLAGTIASLPLMVYRTDRSGARQVAADHPLYRILHDSPNSLQTAVDFWEFMSASLELRGNAYARVVRSAGRVVSLLPASASFMDVSRTDSGRLRYRWTDDSDNYDETSDTMLHIRGFGGGPLGGLSTIQFGGKVFGISNAIHSAAGNTFKNGLRPSGTLTFDKFLTNEQREIVENKLVEKFVGSVNSGRPMVLEGGSKWAFLTINPDDAQMLESRAFSIEEVCRMFGVPPHMVGHTQNSTSWGTGLEQQTLGFQKFTLRRRLKRIEQALQKQLLSPNDIAQGITIEFSLEGLLRGDSAARSNFYASGLINGWMTINEVRGLENLPPVPGGDEPRTQMQNVPITALPARSEVV